MGLPRDLGTEAARWMLTRRVSVEVSNLSGAPELIALWPLMGNVEKRLKTAKNGDLYKGYWPLFRDRSLCYNKESGALEIQASGAAVEGNWAEYTDFALFPEVTFFGGVPCPFYSVLPTSQSHELSISGRVSRKLKRASFGGFLDRVPACCYCPEGFEGGRAGCESCRLHCGESILHCPVRRWPALSQSQALHLCHLWGPSPQQGL